MVLIATITKGKYYIAREDVHFRNNPNIVGLTTCSICEFQYEKEDMAFCPLYESPICSLCCSLEVHCYDACKIVPSSSN